MQFSRQIYIHCKNNKRKNRMQSICKLNFVSNGTVKVLCLEFFANYLQFVLDKEGAKQLLNNVHC